MASQTPRQSLIETIASVLVPIHRAGWPFIAAFVFISFLLAMVSGWLGAIGAVATAWCVYFFRDPARLVPTDPNVVVSPADGVVQMIQPATPPSELDMGEAKRLRISVFLNVFNVHVNRVPASGTIVARRYRKGKFLNASLDKASVDNERMSLRLETPHHGDLAFVQIAGLVARRIVCDVTEGEAVRAGERFGLIRFGSRVDVYLPENTAPLVAEGQTMIAGETVLAVLGEDGPEREAEVR